MSVEWLIIEIVLVIFKSNTGDVIL